MLLFPAVVVVGVEDDVNQDMQGSSLSVGFTNRCSALRQDWSGSDTDPPFSTSSPLPGRDCKVSQWRLSIYAR